MCVSVLYRNPNGWTDQDKIRHGGGPQGGKVLGVFLARPPPPAYGVRKGGPSGAMVTHYEGELIK